MNAKKLLPLSGVAAVLLMLAAFIIGGESPEADDSLRDVVSYYTDNDSDVQWASALLALGAFFFLVFSTTLSDRFRRLRPGASTAARLTFAGGIVFTVGTTIFAGLSFTAADVAEDIAPSGLQALNALSMDMFFTVAVGTAAFMLGAGIASLKSELLPKWLAWVAIVIGVLALTPAGFIAFLALGVWSLVVSVILAMRAGDDERDEPPMPAAAA